MPLLGQGKSAVYGCQAVHTKVRDQPVRTEKSRTDTICLVSRSARKLRPEPIVERFVACFERVLAVVAVDAQDQALRRQAMIPIDDRDRALVVVPKPRERRQGGGDAGRGALLGQEALIGDPGV